MLKYICLVIALSVLTIDSFAQKINIIGIVKTADGYPSESISVVLKNTTYGALTNAEGKFEFEAPEGEYTMVVYSIFAHRKEFPVTIKSGSPNYFPDITILENKNILDEIVVTGTRTEKRLSDAPILTTVISERDIRKAGSVSTLESLQDNVPGIVSTPNGMGNNIRIKGLNSRYILFMVDGERLVSEGAGGNVNLDQIDVSSIKQIEMINGAASALYGSNAVGAVINIITKQPAHAIEAGANLIAESNNTWRMKADVGSSLKKFSTAASFFRNSSDGFGGDGDGVYAARYEDYGANLKLGYKPTERLDINLVSRYFRHESFNPENSMNAKHPLTENLTLGANGGILSTDKKNSLRLSANFGKYFDYEVLEKKNNDQDLKNTASYFSARALDTYSLSEKWEFVGGLEYNHEENYATATLGSTPTTKAIDDMNVFAQADYEVIKNLDIVSGARYTYNTQFGSALTPKLSLMYKVTGFTFRGGVGTAFRAPSIKELYYDFDHQGMFWVYGNPDLKPEKGLYTSLSAEYTKRNLDISVSVYYNDIDNKITQYDVINEQGGDEKYYKNVSSATLRGIDVTLSYILLRDFVLKANYSYCDAVDNSTGLQLSSNVKHSATTSVTWNGRIAKSPFSLQFSGYMNSPKLYQQRITDASGEEHTEYLESKAYSVWKAVLVKPFNLKKHLFELTFKADNLFNFQEASFINPGRQYLVGIRYRFK